MADKDMFGFFHNSLLGKKSIEVIVEGSLEIAALRFFKVLYPLEPITPPNMSVFQLRTFNNHSCYTRENSGWRL